MRKKRVRYLNRTSASDDALDRFFCRDVRRTPRYRPEQQTFFVFLGFSRRYFLASVSSWTVCQHVMDRRRRDCTCHNIAVGIVCGGLHVLVFVLSDTGDGLRRGCP
jgi:hypothetical protein